MAHTGIFATSSECIKKMGSGYDSVNITEAVINDFCAQAEAYINVITDFNWSDTYATDNEDVKRLLSMAESSLVGIWGAMFDLSDYNSSREAENIININWKCFILACKALTKAGARSFMKKENE